LHEEGFLEAMVHCCANGNHQLWNATDHNQLADFHITKDVYGNDNELNFTDNACSSSAASYAIVKHEDNFQRNDEPKIDQGEDWSHFCTLDSAANKFIASESQTKN
jgi:hypothetical protein